MRIRRHFFFGRSVIFTKKLIWISNNLGKHMGGDGTHDFLFSTFYHLDGHFLSLEYTAGDDKNLKLPTQDLLVKYFCC